MTCIFKTLLSHSCRYTYFLSYDIYGMIFQYITIQSIFVSIAKGAQALCRNWIRVGLLLVSFLKLVSKPWAHGQASCKWALIFSITTQYFTTQARAQYKLCFFVMYKLLWNTQNNISSSIFFLIGLLRSGKFSSRPWAYPNMIMMKFVRMILISPILVTE